MKSDLQIRPPDVAANLPARSGSGAACAVACLVAMLSSAGAAPLKPSPEDRYITTRDAAIEKFSPKYDAGNFDDIAKQAEQAAFADRYQRSANLGPYFCRRSVMATSPEGDLRLVAPALACTGKGVEWGVGVRWPRKLL